MTRRRHAIPIVLHRGFLFTVAAGQATIGKTHELNAFPARFDEEVDFVVRLETGRKEWVGTNVGQLFTRAGKLVVQILPAHKASEGPEFSQGYQDWLFDEINRNLNDLYYGRSHIPG